MKPHFYTFDHDTTNPDFIMEWTDKDRRFVIWLDDNNESSWCYVDKDSFSEERNAEDNEGHLSTELLEALYNYLKVILKK